jgi:hypothetical protein
VFLSPSSLSLSLYLLSSLHARRRCTHCMLGRTSHHVTPCLLVTPPSTRSRNALVAPHAVSHPRPFVGSPLPERCLLLPR